MYKGTVIQLGMEALRTAVWYIAQWLEYWCMDLSSLDPSKILVNPSPDTKIEKEDVTLSCEYEGKPKPTVEWFVNDTTKLNPSDPRIQITNTGDVKGVNSSLTIYNLNRTDEGCYKCVVSNSIKANVSSTEAQLTVNCKLHFNLFFIIITTIVTDHYLSIRSTRRTCPPKSHHHKRIKHCYPDLWGGRQT